MAKQYYGDMSDCGLRRLEDVLSNLDPMPLPGVGKVAVGGMTTNFPTGLELESHRFSLLKSSGGEFDHPATHAFRRGDKLRHQKTGIHCTFRRDVDGIAEVEYSEGDIARHTYSDLEATEGHKAILAALAKSVGFRIGDEVRLPDGSRGKIVKLNHDAAEVKTRTGSAMVLVQDLRAPGGGESGAYRFIPRGTTALSQAAGTSLLKGVRPFLETPAATGNGGSMDDCGL